MTCMLKPIFHIAIFQTRTWLFCRACIHTYTYQHIPSQGFGSWPTLIAYLRKCPLPSPGTFDIIICEKLMLSYLLNQKISKEFRKKKIILSRPICQQKSSYTCNIRLNFFCCFFFFCHAWIKVIHINCIIAYINSSKTDNFQNNSLVWLCDAIIRLKNFTAWGLHHCKSCWWC